MSKPGKKRPEQHRIDTEGLKFFEAALPNSKAASFVFTREENDYGIDGQIQVVIQEEHTGEFFKVQIKSTKAPKYIDEGKYLSFSLDIDSAYFLIEGVKNPTAFVVVDVDKQKVFWHPIQTDSDSRTALEESLTQKSMTIKISTSNILSPDSYQDFYDYLKQAQARLSRKEVLETKTNKTLSTGMEFLSEVERKTLDLEGFTPYFRNASDPVRPGTVFSVSYNSTRAIDYTPSESFRPELAPKINITTRFSTKTKEGKSKADAFQQLVEKGRGTVELPNDNISSFQVKSGDTIIDDMSSVVKGMRLVLSPSIEKRRVNVFISNGPDELENTAETWLDQGKIHIESIEGQPIKITTSFSATDGAKATFNIRINSNLLTGASQEKRLMEFFKGLQSMEISFLDNEGFRRKMFGGTLDGNRMVNDESYELVKALSEIEGMSGVPIAYPLPDQLTRNDISNVFWVYKLLKQGKVTQDLTFRFKLRDKPPQDLRKGGAMVMSQSPPEIYLFGKPYLIPQYKQQIQGVISELEKKSGEYIARLKKAEVLITRVEQAPGL